jgi:hypothetical protein
MLVRGCGTVYSRPVNSFIQVTLLVLVVVTDAP